MPRLISGRPAQTHSVRPAPRLGLGLVGAALLATLAACGSNSSSVTTLVGAALPPDVSCQQLSGTTNVVVGSGVPGDPSLPEASSGYKLGKKTVLAKDYMISTANPLASAAGCAVLQRGGSAIDAAVAVQMVLGLVEPQSSGLGGGAFMLHYDAKKGEVISYDGRETAPAAATPDYLRYVGATAATGAPLPNARASGRSIGTPGAVRMLELAHQSHGKLPWASLMEPGTALATNGFAISGRLADAIEGNRTQLMRDAEATAYFLNADFSGKKLGTTLKNPAYAATLQAMAAGGANALYTGPIAQAIVDKIKITSGGATSTTAITPGLTELSDLANYKAIKRTPVCSNYRGYVVCGMGPPSSGGIAVAQTLGMLQNFDMGNYKPAALDVNGGKPSILGVHVVTEAQRLAYADRNQYVADTDFVALPGAGLSSMLDRNYLKNRADLIRLDRSMGTAVAGTFTGNATAYSPSATEGNGTTHVSIVDKAGNVVVLTTTVESSMGSWHMARGFLLNNQLTDFSAAPSDANGPIANRVEALKRPRSSMAPTLVFKANADGSRGEFFMATGSPGGAAIIQFVTKTVVGVIDWGMDAQQATSQMNFGAGNSVTTGLGGEHPNLDLTNKSAGDTLVVGLRNLGHTVSTAAQSSGVATIIRVNPLGTPGYAGGADPRREGIVLGDGVAP